MAEENLMFVRGDSLEFGAVFEDLDQDLDAAYFTIRKNWDGDLIAQKTIGDGIVKVKTGEYTVRVAPEDTEDVDAGFYVYDFCVHVNSDVYTILRGTLELLPDATYTEA